MERKSWFRIPEEELRTREYTIEERMEKAIEILNLPPVRRDNKAIYMLSKLMKSIGFFKTVHDDYGHETLIKLCRYFTYETKPKSSIVFKQGERGRVFFILLKGRAGVNLTFQRTVSKPDGSVEVEFYLNEVAEKVAGDSFGELALIEDKPRTATIICKEECHFAVLDRDPYKEILAAAQQEKIDEQINFFLGFPLFANTSRRVLSTFIYHFQQKRYNMNDWVYKQGDEPQYIYFIKRGEFTMMREVEVADLIDFGEPELKMMKHKTPRKTLKIANLQSGQIIGLEDVVEGRKRAESVRCIQNNSLVYYVKKQDFLRRFCSNSYDEVGKSVKAYAQARIEFHNERENEIKEVAQMKREYMLNQPMKSNKKISAYRQVIEDPDEMSDSEPPERTETQQSVAARDLSPANNADFLMTETETSMTERRGAKILALPGTQSTEQSFSGKKQSLTPNDKKHVSKRGSFSQASKNRTPTDPDNLESFGYSVSEQKNQGRPKYQRPSLRLQMKKPGDSSPSRKQYEEDNSNYPQMNDAMSMASHRTRPYSARKGTPDHQRVDTEGTSEYSKQNQCRARDPEGSQTTRQYLQKKAIVQTVRARPRSLNRPINTEQSEESAAKTSRSKDANREYMSFKKCVDDESIMFGYKDQNILLENKAYLMAKMERNSRVKELDILKYLIQREKESRVLKRRKDTVNIDPAFKAKQEELKKRESLRTTKNKLTESRFDETLIMLDDPQPRASFKIGDRQFTIEGESTSSPLYQRQLTERGSIEPENKVIYPLHGLKQSKPPISMFKQMQFARKHRKLAKKLDDNEEPPRIHSYKVHT